MIEACPEVFAGANRLPILGSATSFDPATHANAAANAAYMMKH
jgi:hypothetical protein